MVKWLHISVLMITAMALLLLSAPVCEAQGDGGALEMLARKAREYKDSGEHLKLAQTLSKMGYAYSQTRDYGNAIDAFKKAATLYLQNNKLSDVRKLYSNIGLMYTEMEEYENALTYMKMALKTARLHGNDTDVAGCQTDVAYILIIEKEYRVAIEQLLEALAIAQDINHRQLTIKCYAMLMECYRALGISAKFAEYKSKLGNLQAHASQEEANQQVTGLVREKKAAKERQELEERVRQLEEEQNRRNIQEADARREEKRLSDIAEAGKIDHAKQAKELREEQERIRQKRDLEARNRERHSRMVGYLSWGGVGLALLLMLFFMAWRNSRKSRQLNTLLQENNRIVQEHSAQVEKWARELADTNEKISLQQQAIADSIAYAKHIQMSMLISRESLRRELPQLAIFFRPRDAVSGDFYWYHQKGGKKYIAAIDCTGHGVPGAMISMVGCNILENIMASTSLVHPADIMDRMHADIRSTLRQDTTDNHDGMDMSMCMIDCQTSALEYCGAKNALVIARPGMEPEKVKPSPFGVGGMVPDDPENPNPSGERHFKNVEVPVYGDATYYIFSDGFSDQFGGSLNKKYMLGRFRKMLAGICHLPMDEQEARLEKEFLEWKGPCEQTDDILVIGFRVQSSMKTIP